MKTEIWKDIVGYEGMYQVSSFGRVKSFKRTVTYGERYHTVCSRIKKQTLKKKKEKYSGGYSEDGYMMVNLYKHNKGAMNYVHRLVADAFIPNPEVKETVNHIDGIKANNHFSNLEWATHLENVTHAIDTGLTNHAHLHTANNKKSKRIKQYDKDMNLIAEYLSMRDAERKNNMANGSISKAIKKNWMSYGYWWKIKE